MSRIARVTLEGVPYHVTQRGNGKQQIFFSDSDYLLYQRLLRDHSKDQGLRIWAYCLMPNHMHLIVVPRQPDSMAKALGRIHSEYAKFFNLRRESCGHVWQARYFSCPLDGRHLWRAMAYVERNPVRAGMVEEADRYRWSSAATHLGRDDRARLLDLEAWRREYSPERWREALRTGIDEEELTARIRDATVRGRPLGTAEFIEELERKTVRRLRPLPVGRPRKRPASSMAESPQLSLEIGV